jgi:hypothetical protein
VVRYYFLLIIIQILKIHTKYKLYIQNINFIYMKNIYRFTTNFLTYEKISTMFRQKKHTIFIRILEKYLNTFFISTYFLYYLLEKYITLYFIFFIFILFLYTKYIYQGVTYLLYGILIKFI